MIGEIVRSTEFDQRHLFDRFLERSRVSVVPLEFGLAHGRVVASLASSRSTGGASQEGNFPEIAYRLFQRQFPALEHAQYALHYADTVSVFKTYDSVHTRVEPIRTEYAGLLHAYNNYLARLSNSLGCSIEEVPERAKGRPILNGELNYYQGEMAELMEYQQQLNPVDRKAKETAEFAARVILGVESNWVNPDNSPLAKALRQAFGGEKKAKRKMTEKDLQTVRAEVEDYFSVEQNRARIFLLSR